jgi:hypothetical protein
MEEANFEVLHVAVSLNQGRERDAGWVMDVGISLGSEHPD